MHHSLLAHMIDSWQVKYIYICFSDRQDFVRVSLSATEMRLKCTFDYSFVYLIINAAVTRINGSSKVNHPAAIGKDKVKVKGIAQLAVRRVPISPHTVALSIQNPSSSTTVPKP